MKKNWDKPEITILNVVKTAGGSNPQVETTKTNGTLSNGTAS